MGPVFVISQGKSAHSKHSLIPLLNAQVATLQNLLSLAIQPRSLFGQMPLTIRGHFSQAIPHTPIFIFQPPLNLFISYRSNFANRTLGSSLRQAVL